MVTDEESLDLPKRDLRHDRTCYFSDHDGIPCQSMAVALFHRVGGLWTQLLHRRSLVLPGYGLWVPLPHW